MVLADPGRRAKVQKQALVDAKDADERAMAQASVPSLLVYIVRKQGIAGQCLSLLLSLSLSLSLSLQLVLWRSAVLHSAACALTLPVYRPVQRPSDGAFQRRSERRSGDDVREQEDIIATRVILGGFVRL